MKGKTRTLLVVAIAAIGLTIPLPRASAEGRAHWSYEGATGPQAWGSLEKEFAVCGVGKTQSPIDIRDEDVKAADLPAIRFDYKPATLRIVDNGHTIQVSVEPGSSLAVGGKTYALVQFHFHRPSEERINGKAFDMVAHLVHRDAEGKLAVVAVLLRRGAESPLVKALWSHVPKEKGKASVVEGVKLNAADLLPESKAYYTFPGSLTIPPCTEGVTWFVLRTPVEVSAGQDSAFGAIYPMNARPVQPTNGRTIQASK